MSPRRNWMLSLYNFKNSSKDELHRNPSKEWHATKQGGDSVPPSGGLQFFLLCVEHTKTLWTNRTKAVNCKCCTGEGQNIAFSRPGDLFVIYVLVAVFTNT